MFSKLCRSLAWSIFSNKKLSETHFKEKKWWRFESNSRHKIFNGRFNLHLSQNSGQLNSKLKSHRSSTKVIRSIVNYCSYMCNIHRCFSNVKWYSRCLFNYKPIDKETQNKHNSRISREIRTNNTQYNCDNAAYYLHSTNNFTTNGTKSASHR